MTHDANGAGRRATRTTKTGKGTKPMTRSLSIGLGLGAACVIAAAWQVADLPAAWAQQPAPPPPMAPGPPEPAASTAMTTPALTGPLVANPNPITFDTGVFGKMYFTGAITGMGLFQSDPVPGNSHTHFDLTNGHFMLQKTEGMVQFFTQGGVYSFPALGAPYFHVAKTTGNTFGAFPVAYGKLAPTDEFSVLVGKLPTLIGAEYAFTYQNMNIERGLLWNQEPIISRGIQANYATGPLTLSLSLNDGFYSNNYNWITGLASYAMNKENTVAVAAGGNFGRSAKNNFVTFLNQNNSTIVNLIYTYNAAPWTITPYFQYTNVPANPAIGIASQGSTYGGAILANYNINDNVNLAARAEYIGSSGSNNLLYGPGSSAASLTLTPTWQNGVYFLRGEASVVQAFDTPGAFGRAGTARTQARWVLETGIMF